MGQSGVRLFEQRIADLGYNDSLHALDWMMEEMAAPKFARQDGTHYYNHLVDVAQDLLNHGVRNQDIITAALLHDAVEDVPGITLNMVTGKFNASVAKMVDLVTKEPGVNYKEGDLIKVLYLEPILENVGAALIKTADRKHNFSTLRNCSPEKKMRQAIETERFFFPFFEEAMNRYPRYAPFFVSAKTAIKPHLLEIKEHYDEVNALKAELADFKARYNIVPVAQ